MASEDEEIPSPAEVKKQLERMRRDEALRGSPSQSKLFNFVVRSALRNRKIREVHITAIMFPKGHHDPEPSNARATATNLRKTLAKYYETAGSEDPVIIDLPPGKAYKPIFSYNLNSEAHKAYRRGLAHLNQYLSSDDARLTLDYLDEAIRLEPSYALAYAAKAEALFREALYQSNDPPGARIALAEASAREALVWDPRVWRAHVVLGAVHCSRFRWDAATAAFDAALKIAPLEATEHLYYLAFLAATGRLDDAIELAERTTKRRGEDLFAKFALAALYYLSPDEAKRLRSAHQLAWIAIRENKRLPHGYILQACITFSIGIATGILSTNAESKVEDWHRLFGIEAFPGLAILCFGAVVDRTREGKERREKQAILHQRIARLEIKSRESYVPPLQLALAHLAAHETDEAIADLERACDEGDPKMIWLHLWPQFDPLREHKGFQALCSRLKLP